MKNILFILILLLGSCEFTSITPTTDKYAHIKDSKAREIIKKAIIYSGGLEKWDAKKSLGYSKNYTLFSADGAVEKQVRQMHNYQYTPLYIDIKSTENDELIHTIQQINSYQQTKNGQVTERSKEEIARTINTSTYLLGMPFKLLDEGAEIQYGGQIAFQGKEVDVIKVHYDANKCENHSSTEFWEFYFEQTTAQFAGYWVALSNHYNTVENISFEQVDGLRLIKERKSYRADNLRNRLYLRADYVYGDYEVK